MFYFVDQYKQQDLEGLEAVRVRRSINDGHLDE